MRMTLSLGNDDVSTEKTCTVLYEMAQTTLKETVLVYYNCLRLG